MPGFFKSQLSQLIPITTLRDVVFNLHFPIQKLQRRGVKHPGRTRQELVDRSKNRPDVPQKKKNTQNMGAEGTTQNGA